MKTRFLILLIILLPMLANAYDFEVDGIYYTITSTEYYTVEVANASIDESEESAYHGDIVIPANVSYYNMTFSVTGIGNYAFCYYRSVGGGSYVGLNRKMTSITLPESITYIGYGAFHGCSLLKDIVIPNNVTDIQGEAFSGCRGLENISLSNRLKGISRMCFYKCIALSSISLPESVNYIGNEAFNGCSKLATINLPQCITGLGEYIFKDCTGLDSIDLSHVQQLGYGTFEGCIKLEKIELPEGMTTLGKYTFRNCTGLKEITLPSTLTNMGTETFTNCSNIEIINSRIQSPNNCYLNEACFQSITYMLATLVVPLGKSELYRATNGWKKFNNIIEENQDEPPVQSKCATPTIKYESGHIQFTCETDGVTYVSSVICEDNKNHDTSIVPLTAIYKISVYAKKDGYDDSDIVTKEISIRGLKGDVDEDGDIKIADVTTLIDILLGKE